MLCQCATSLMNSLLTPMLPDCSKIFQKNIRYIFTLSSLYSNHCESPHKSHKYKFAIVNARMKYFQIKFYILIKAFLRHIVRIQWLKLWNMIRFQIGFYILKSRLELFQLEFFTKLQGFQLTQNKLKTVKNTCLKEIIFIVYENR